ncbi:ATPase inhibitor A, mitochondrial [Drosophila subpulchrella]|uniref:ATPase inhibitor A, mitochondrial n=1 Tax=Drosophila subpulchrella TaxID=1486046 RepID=UPI0007E33DE8|nr:ATPase inhibitor A, mitochondrial [Drosophila suzukii]XP_037715660.1 ATPase inhibitor A, mitochondrial [Drosophila subpulchrella]
MFTLRRLSQRLYPQQIQHLKMSQIGELGSGAGKGGGGGGSIREAGGSFGKMEAAREEEFFHKQQKEQLKNLKAKTEPKAPEAPKK